METTTQYGIRDREAGNVIETNLELKQANATVRLFEELDKKEGIFESNFYEVFEMGVA